MGDRFVDHLYAMLTLNLDDPSNNEEIACFELINNENPQRHSNCTATWKQYLIATVFFFSFVIFPALEMPLPLTLQYFSIKYY